MDELRLPTPDDEPPDVVLGSYVFVRPNPRADWMSKTLPDALISMSSHLSSVWPAGAPRVTEQETLAELRSCADRHGIADERLADCARWLFLGIKRGELRWPYVMASLDVAKTCADVAGLDMTSYGLFATALWTGHVAAYVSETVTPGVSQTLAEGNPPAPGGTLLGWDVLGTEYGGHLDHSWLCGSIQDEVAEDLGIVPNDLGLLNTLAEAAAVVRWIDDGDGMRGEPASWFPWQVLRYQSP